MKDGITGTRIRTEKTLGKRKKLPYFCASKSSCGSGEIGRRTILRGWRPTGVAVRICSSAQPKVPLRKQGFFHLADMPSLLVYIHEMKKYKHVARLAVRIRILLKIRGMAYDIELAHLKAPGICYGREDGVFLPHGIYSAKRITVPDIRGIVCFYPPFEGLFSGFLVGAFPFAHQKIEVIGLATGCQ